MFVDIWVFLILSAVVGICAVWNRYAGFKEGIDLVISELMEEKIITITEGGKIKPYAK